MKKTLRPRTIIKAKHKHGFRARMRTAGGRNVLRRRRRKGKKRLIVV